MHAWTLTLAGNLGQDLEVFMADLFFSRSLQHNNFVLWASPTTLPDLGGAETDVASESALATLYQPPPVFDWASGFTSVGATDSGISMLPVAFLIPRFRPPALPFSFVLRLTCLPWQAFLRRSLLARQTVLTVCWPPAPTAACVWSWTCSISL